MLRGVARFNVAHSLVREFNVRTKNAAVIDLGTDFIVRAYPADSLVTVAVGSGLVAVQSLSRSPPARWRNASFEIRAGSYANVDVNGQPAMTGLIDRKKYAMLVDSAMK